ncbi:hypothetical protein LCM27_13715 [Ruegeria marisrubri]|uniref:hypothetical protein n=1 Tax=Ruegeria marisrubri TaxID=1685379 RepID=UPI001CD4C1E6|nr:hypothetical protein [Ruegeria marisrubri]MCA0907453.1 hypothetical protein [Ruegeria marisrubri]
MDPQLRAQYAISRFQEYHVIMRTTLFSFVGIAAIISFAPDGYALAQAILVIAVTIYGVVAGGSALDDLESLRDDIDGDFAQTHYARGIKKKNMKALKLMSHGLLGLIGLVLMIASFV